MADIISITTLAGEFKSETELQTYCNKQFEALNAAATKIEELQKEVDELKNLLVTSSSLISDPKVIITPEEATCLAQIAILEQRSRTKELTLEETKKFDLFIKNLKIIRENNPKTLEVKPSRSDLSDIELRKLASQGSQVEQD